MPLRDEDAMLSVLFEVSGLCLGVGGRELARPEEDDDGLQFVLSNGVWYRDIICTTSSLYLRYHREYNLIHFFAWAGEGNAQHNSHHHHTTQSIFI